MKSTGIIKRVDDLGKIQIPRELSRLLNIGVGELMEFFTLDNHIVLVPYDPNNDVRHAIEKFRLYIMCDVTEHQDELLAKLDEMNAILDAEGVK